MVPRTSEWRQPFEVGGPNTFRANAQGAVGATEYPDATARFDPGTACRGDAETVTLTATICNRGGRPIGARMPVVFRDSSPGEAATCVTEVDDQIPGGMCVVVECTMTGGLVSPIRVRANDDGTGAGSTIECDDGNNEATLAAACD